MKKILLIRHPEISQAESGRFYGHTDVRLSRHGIKQAHRMVRKLAKEKIDLVYSSDLYRTKYPARLLAQRLNIEHISRKELREVNFGEWEGLTFQQIEKSAPVLCRNWLHHPHKFQFPNGESIGKLLNRLQNEYYSILNGSHSDNLAIITHGGVIRILLCEILQLNITNMWRIQIDFGALNTIAYANESEFPGRELPRFQDAHPIILAINDVGYLQD